MSATRGLEDGTKPFGPARPRCPVFEVEQTSKRGFLLGRDVWVWHKADVTAPLVNVRC
jgi:hypothetical protein